MRLDELFKHKPMLVKNKPKKGIWFQHQSGEWLSKIIPQTYKQLRKIRPGYPIKDRIKEEDVYRSLLDTSKTRSFIYATPVGFNMFEDPNKYPGYTYYFKLNINKCVFDVVDKKTWMQPTKGLKGLKLAKKIWADNKNKFKSFNAPDIGTIYPRIEVIIPYSIYPKYFFPQKEDRD